MFEPSWRIVNMICSMNTEPVDLEKLEEAFPDMERTQRQNALFWDDKKSNRFVLVFNTGWILFRRGRSLADIQRHSRAILKRLKEAGHPGRVVQDVRVDNLVVSGDWGINLHLDTLLRFLGTETASYEPEQFPGLFYTSPEPVYFSTLYRSGKFILTKIKEEAAIGPALEDMGAKLAASSATRLR